MQWERLPRTRQLLGCSFGKCGVSTSTARVILTTCRYWTDDCQSKLDGNGEFVAGRFATTVVPPPPVPTMQNFPWSDAAVHLNRTYVCRDNRSLY